MIRSAMQLSGSQSCSLFEEGEDEGEDKVDGEDEREVGS
jgi:hypothetical protein